MAGRRSFTLARAREDPLGGLQQMARVRHLQLYLKSTISKRQDANDVGNVQDKQARNRKNEGVRPILYRCHRIAFCHIHTQSCAGRFAASS
jgi:hypothetical protein